MARYVIGIVGAAEAEAANAAANEFFGDSGNNLGVPCSSDGSEPATHFIGGAWIGDETWAALQQFAAAYGFTTLTFCEHTGPDAEALPAIARAALFDEFDLTPLGVEI